MTRNDTEDAICNHRRTGSIVKAALTYDPSIDYLSLYLRLKVELKSRSAVGNGKRIPRPPVVS